MPACLVVEVSAPNQPPRRRCSGSQGEATGPAISTGSSLAAAVLDGSVIQTGLFDLSTSCVVMCTSKREDIGAVAVCGGGGTVPLKRLRLLAGLFSLPRHSCRRRPPWGVSPIGLSADLLRELGGGQSVLLAFP